MKMIFLILILIGLTNCNSVTKLNFLKEKSNIKEVSERKLKKIFEKSNNLISLSFEEFEIFIDQYVKKSKYPDLNE